MDKIGFETSKENAEKLAFSMYLGETCRICGKIIESLEGVVYAGYSKDNKSRSAHGECWKNNQDKSTWAHPE